MVSPEYPTWSAVGNCRTGRADLIYSPCIFIAFYFSNGPHRPCQGQTNQTCVLVVYSCGQTQLTVLPVRRPQPCKAEFVAMLGCWAATGDVLSADPTKCKEVADALFNCMRTTVGRLPSCVPCALLTSCAVARLSQATKTVHQLPFKQASTESQVVYLTVLDIHVLISTANAMRCNVNVSDQVICMLCLVWASGGAPCAPAVRASWTDAPQECLNPTRPCPQTTKPSSFPPRVHFHSLFHSCQITQRSQSFGTTVSFHPHLNSPSSSAFSQKTAALPPIHLV